MKQFLLQWLALMLAVAGSALAGSPPPAARPLAAVLAPDGTLRPGATGSFDARQFALYTAPDGRPAFRPSSTAGAGDAYWQGAGDIGQPGGADLRVSAVVVAGNTIYIGGAFAMAGTTAASRVAKWDGTAWSSLGSGITGVAVAALALAPNGDLYAGGDFSQAGGQPANNVARWNGSSWSSLGTGLNGGFVLALAVAPNGDLYASGTFSQAGGQPANNVARWNGSSWSSLGTGLSGGGVNGTWVFALTLTPTGDLYAGGNFSQAGAVAANHIARWNGTAWSSLGAGVNGDEVCALAVAPNGDLYASGGAAGGVPANFLTRWNGSTWTNIGPALVGSSSGIRSLVVAANGDVYVGGHFALYMAGGISITNVAKWNGTTWSGLGAVYGGQQGATSYVFALALNGRGELVLGGDFIFGGGLDVDHLALWDGTTWSGIGNVAPTSLHSGVALTVAVAPTGDVYAGGIFTHAGTTLTRGIAKWDGTAWHALGTGLDGSVLALAVAPNGDVYAGGTFTQAGGLPASNVARWDGTAWHALGAGVNATVKALAVGPNGEVYAGGDFTEADGLSAYGIARWNGTTWSSVGTILYDNVTMLAVGSNGDVYASGFIQGNGLARWDGTTWHGLGGSNITGMAVAANGDVYISSYVSSLGRPPVGSIWLVRGTTWTMLATNIVANGTNLALAANGDLYAAGWFHQFNGQLIESIARWDGTTWSSLGTGLNNNVHALATDPAGRVYVSGNFTAVGDGSKKLPSFAIYDRSAALPTRGPAAVAGVALFPNPAHAEVTVQLPAAHPRQPLLLADELGRIVRQYPAPAGTTAVLDLRGLPTGVYLVRSGRFSQRLVVE